MAHGGRATTSHGSFRVSLVRPDELGETESACWAAFRRDAPEAASPFMSLTFARIVGAVRREARVAIIDNADGIQGYLPLEIHGHRTARPLGWPMNDFQGFIQSGDHRRAGSREGRWSARLAVRPRARDADMPASASLRRWDRRGRGR